LRQPYKEADMFNTVSREALLALELFRLNPRSKKGHEVILQHLVEVAIHTNPENRSTSEIVNTCLGLMGQSSGFGETECNAALSECCRLGRVKQVSTDEYSLTDEVDKELSHRNMRFQEAEKAFNTGLVESIGKVLNTVVNPIAEPFLCGIVRDAIQQAFYDSAIRLHKLLDSKSDILAAIDKDYDIDSQLIEKFRPFTMIQTGATPEQTLVGVRQFLNNLDETQRHFIGNLHRRVFYFQILDIDPRLQELEKQSFTNTRVYLDTNVAIIYLCDGTRMHQPVFDILRTALSLGTKLFVSPFTIKELEGIIEEASKFSNYLKDGRITKILQANPNALSNPIIDGFINLKRSHTSLNWEAYVTPFHKLEEYLLSYDVVPEEEDCDGIESDEEYIDVYNQISDIKMGKPTVLLNLSW